MGTLWLPSDNIKPDQLSYNKHHITLLKTYYFKTMAVFQSSNTSEILKLNLGRKQRKKEKKTRLEGNYYVTVHRIHSEHGENKSTFRVLLSISLPFLIVAFAR